MKFAKFLRAPFFTEHLRWLVLKIEAQAFLLTIRHGLMNFKQVGGYKANAHARGQFCHFEFWVGNIGK